MKFNQHNKTSGEKMTDLKIVAFAPMLNNKITGVYEFDALPTSYAFSFETGLIGVQNGKEYRLEYVLKNQFNQIIYTDQKQTKFIFSSEISEKQDHILNGSITLTTIPLSIPAGLNIFDLNLKIFDSDNHELLAEANTHFATMLSD